MRITGWIFILPLLIAGLARAAEVALVVRGDRVGAGNGILNIAVDLHTGLCDYGAVDCPMRIKSAAAAIAFQPHETRVLSSDYSSHELVNANLQDVSFPMSGGKQFIIRHTRPGSVATEQIFTLFPDRPWFVMQVRARSDKEISSNWIAPLVVGNANVSALTNYSAATRIIKAPFDNDDWRWYIAQRLDGSDAVGTSHEFSAIYDGDRGAGVVVGSITHDFWKTGIDYRIGNTPGSLQQLTVYGGAKTDDVCPHGAMVGKVVESPAIFLGFYGDVRKGLAEFGRTNAMVAPPLPWHDGVPFGWMTFGALGAHYTPGDIVRMSDFIRSHLQSAGFHDQNGKVCIILDGNRVSISQDDLKALVGHIHANGQEVGCYLAPFIFWRRGHQDTLAEKFDGSEFTYGQVVLRDDGGKPIQHKPRSYVLDVTHPAVRKSIIEQIDWAKNLGFDYFKFDFMSEGILEGHHADPNIRTGVQAYNQAMKLIVDRIGPGKFISLSIAPAFPGQYAQSRRISCDLYSQLNDKLPGYRPFGSTQYLLNCATYSWWMGGNVVDFNDPDQMAIYRYGNAPPIPESWARARIAASIVAGGNFVDTSNYADPASAGRVEKMLAAPAVDELARQGIAFAPVWDDQMDHETATVFYRSDKSETTVAVFNFDPKSPVTRTIRFRQIGLANDRDYVVRNILADRVVAGGRDKVQLQIGAGDALLLRIEMR